MRVVAELPRPDCKITIFYMNMKYLIKFERGAFEQTYKVSEMDITGGVDEIFKVLDETFISTVIERFELMRRDFGNAYTLLGY